MRVRPDLGMSFENFEVLNSDGNKWWDVAHLAWYAHNNVDKINFKFVKVYKIIFLP